LNAHTDSQLDYLIKDWVEGVTTAAPSPELLLGSFPEGSPKWGYQARLCIALEDVFYAAREHQE
jgi:hypothetical protein